ncbi:MAG: MBL fold metallo-hydrolase [Bacteroidota bacterium]
MVKVVSFTFNPFQENTYLLHDETKECVIFDPGCSNTAEKQELVRYIEQNDLKPVRLINTHCHLDHILGNGFIAEKYNLSLEIHKGEIPVLKFAPTSAAMYGVAIEHSPEPTQFIEEGDIIRFGNAELEAILTPGHSPASLSFYCKADNFVIAGDVLFHGSIGRTDLPGGDFNTLINSIKTKLLVLPDETKVYPGHMQATTIGFEKVNNPFL